MTNKTQLSTAWRMQSNTALLRVAAVTDCCADRVMAITIQKCWRGYLGRQRFAAVLAAHNTGLRQVGRLYMHGGWQPHVGRAVSKTQRSSQRRALMHMLAVWVPWLPPHPHPPLFLHSPGLLQPPCHHHTKVLERPLQPQSCA